MNKLHELISEMGQIIDKNKLTAGLGDMTEDQRHTLTVLAPEEHDKLVGEMVYAIGSWHHQRNLIDGSTDKDQFCKLIQEVGELSDNICKGKDIRDDLGDIMVVLINIMVRNGLSFSECLAQALTDIAPRRGIMRDGIFIKQADLDKEAAAQ